MTKDILKAVNLAIGVAHHDIEINASSVTEGFSRPSFFTALDNVVVDTPNILVQSVSATIRITYFPKSRDGNVIELANMLDSLSEIFRTSLTVSGVVANVDELTGTVEDGVLNASFDLSFSIVLPDNDASELMQTLQYEQEVY